MGLLGEREDVLGHGLRPLLDVPHGFDDGVDHPMTLFRHLDRGHGLIRHQARLAGRLLRHLPKARGRPLSLGDQRELGLFAIGDVEDRSVQPHDLVPLVPDTLSLLVHPPDGAVGSNDPVLQNEGLVAGERVVDALFDPGLVVGMDDGGKGADRAQDEV